MSNYYYSGQGSVLVGTRDANGRPLGLRNIGNVPSLEISVDVTKFEHKESESGSRAIDLTLTQELNATFSMTLESLSPENVALAFFGETAVVTGAAVVDEALTLGALDLIYPLANVNLNSAVPPDVSLTGGIPTYVLGTDYTVDYENGTITPLSSGSIAADADLVIDYTFLSHYRQSMFTVTNIELFMRFQGINTVTSPQDKLIVDIFRAQFDPSQGVPLINDEVSQISMTGTILKDALNLAATGSEFFVERRTSSTA